MHAEILRTQNGLERVLTDQIDRLRTLSPRELDELRSEAEMVFNNSKGTMSGAGSMVFSICDHFLKERKGR